MNSAYVMNMNFMVFIDLSNLGYAVLSHALFERFGSSYGSWKEWMFYGLLIPLDMKNTVLDNERY